MTSLVEDDQDGEAEEGEDPAHAVTPCSNQLAGELTGAPVALEQLLEVGERLAARALEDLADHVGDSGERQALGEKGLNRNLVGRVQRARGGPAGDPGVAREPQAGEELEVRALELEAPRLGEVEPGHGDVGALGKMQRVGDRHAHVGEPQVSELGAVVELDERVDDRLGCTTTSIRS